MATHLYHYHINKEQRFFLGSEHRNLFDVIALNGNIVSHTPAGVAGFIATTGKRFYIDPQTHAFQHSTDKLKRDVSDKKSREPRRLEFRPSIRALVTKHLRDPFTRVIDEDDPLVPDDFLRDDGQIDSDVIEAVCRSVIQFQSSTLINALKPQDKEFIDDDMLKPGFIVAPYFYLGSRHFEKWMQISAACYERTAAMLPDTEVYFALVISKKVLDLASEHVVEMIKSVGPAGVLLWVDDHVEEDLSVSQIRTFIHFVKELRSVCGSVMNTHGSYLSILLCHKQLGPVLDGVAHSINYGESRKVVPVGGGIPMARFYLPPVHSRLRFGDALEIIKAMGWLSSAEAYREGVCKCAQCRDLISELSSIDDVLDVYGETFEREIVYRDGTTVSREFPTAAASQAAARHYLYNKAHEFAQLSGRDAQDLIAELEQSYKLISAKCGFESVHHLHKWHAVLS